MSETYDEPRIKFEILNIEKEILKEEIESMLFINENNEKNREISNHILKLEEISSASKQRLVNMAQNLKILCESNKILSEINHSIERENSELKLKLQELNEQLTLSPDSQTLIDNLMADNEKHKSSLKEKENTIHNLVELNEILKEIEEIQTSTLYENANENILLEKKIYEMSKTIKALNDDASTYNATIQKFRELVKQQNEKIEALSKMDLSQHGQFNENSSKRSDYVVKSETLSIKSQIKCLNDQIKKFNLKQSNESISILITYFPDYFTRSGGDFDGIRLYFLLQRLVFKCRLLIEQIRQSVDNIKFFHVDTTNNFLNENNFGESLASVAVNSFNERTSFDFKILNELLKYHHLCFIYSNCVSNMDHETFFKLSCQYIEISNDESSLDSFIDLFIKKKINETLSVEMIARAYLHLKTVFELQQQRLLKFGDCKSVFLNNIEISIVLSMEIILKLYVISFYYFENKFFDGSFNLLKSLLNIFISWHLFSKKIIKLLNSNQSIHLNENNSQILENFKDHIEALQLLVNIMVNDFHLRDVDEKFEDKIKKAFECFNSTLIDKQFNNLEEFLTLKNKVLIINLDLLKDLFSNMEYGNLDLDSNLNVTPSNHGTKTKIIPFEDRNKKYIEEYKNMILTDFRLGTEAEINELKIVINGLNSTIAFKNEEYELFKIRFNNLQKKIDKINSETSNLINSKDQIIQKLKNELSETTIHSDKRESSHSVLSSSINSVGSMNLTDLKSESKLDKDLLLNKYMNSKLLIDCLKDDLNHLRSYDLKKNLQYLNCNNKPSTEINDKLLTENVDFYKKFKHIRLRMAEETLFKGESII